MDQPHALNRRQAFRLLAGGGAGAAALNTLAGGGAGLAAMLGAMPNRLEAAQAATRRGLPRLKTTDIKYVVVGHMHLDHGGNVSQFPNATMVVQDDEMKA